MFKLFKRIGDRQIAKYYDSENLAAKRKTEKWTLQSHDGEVDYISRSVNRGELASPKYTIVIDDSIKFGCPTEGLANQIVELLSINYSDVKAYQNVVAAVEERVQCDI